jgi:hypothetical protein
LTLLRIFGRLGKALKLEDDGLDDRSEIAEIGFKIFLFDFFGSQLCMEVCHR